MDTPYTDAYKKEIRSMGGVFFPALPANTNLGASAGGKAGARVPNDGPGSRNGWLYVLAPLSVRTEVETGKAGTFAYEWLLGVANAPADALGGLAEHFAVPVGLLVLVVLLALWAFLQAQGILPSLASVFGR